MLSAARTLGVIVGVSVAGAAYDALQVTRDANHAARILFVAAAVLFLLAAALSWTIRAAPARLEKPRRVDLPDIRAIG
jgi:hypothetical protein